eukprot:NODE_7_length_4428_cov_4562.243199_g1_i3.p1 GENE.NODE_7_length_4428_cov_4562.243199_g1_i3~~NODE_7_length_4428_cov_4562.243199_g1_i3.p1  ORF type:complete len:346 (+),score=80.49 NODE_7_length_4428_cov_4562.243199_g1_i3:3281-4318(+)
MHFLSNPNDLWIQTDHNLSILDDENDDDEDESFEASPSIFERIRGFFGNIFDMMRITDVYHVAFLALSILGIFTYGYTYCFHLLHVVVGNDILLRVLQSVTKNGISLLWVAVLGLIIIYIYTILAFAFYRGSFIYEEFLWCDNLFQCFVTCLNYGLRAGGGLGEILLPDTFEVVPVLSRIFFDLSFFIIITVIGLNIIFGIIVDTFSELRDEKFRTDEDIANACFICSLQSYEFDRNGNGFEYHLKKEHNTWSYLFFMAYVEGKSPSEYTTQEAYIARQIAAGEISWFPINRAMALQHEDDEMEKKLDNIQAQINGLVERFREEDRRRVEEENRRRQQEWLQAKA